LKASRLVPGGLTALRVVLTVAVVTAVGRGQVPIAFWLCIAAIITDLLDGHAARRLGACSAQGACFDVAADGFYVLASTAAVGQLGLVPAWYVVLVAGKFAEFILTSRLQVTPGSGIPFVFDPLGRLASAAFLVVPPVALARYHLTGDPAGLLPGLVAAVALLSTAARVARVIGRR